MLGLQRGGNDGSTTASRVNYLNQLALQHTPTLVFVFFEEQSVTRTWGGGISPPVISLDGA